MAKKAEPRVLVESLDEETAMIVRKTLNAVVCRVEEMRDMLTKTFPEDDVPVLPAGWDGIVRNDLDSVRVLLDALERTLLGA